MSYSHREQLRDRAEFSEDLGILIDKHKSHISPEILEQDAQSVFGEYRPDEIVDADIYLNPAEHGLKL